MYSPELQLNKSNVSSLFGFHLSLSNGFVSSEIYNKCDALDFDMHVCLSFWIQYL